MPTYTEIPTAKYRLEFDDGMRAMREKILTLDAPVSIERFVAMSEELKARTVPIRKYLLECRLEWTAEDRALGGWVHSANQRLGTLGRKLVTVAMKRMEADATIVNVIALSLQHIGNGIKCELANGRVAARDYHELHALMQRALDLDCATAKVVIGVQGRQVPVGLDALYFRALLLARFAHGALTLPQIEILDSWIWNCREVLRSSTQPGALSFRADLDSTGGLRQGPRADGGAALYLPLEPIEEAFHLIVADFHAGRLDRGASIAATLPVSEHVAVLEVLRRGLARAEMARTTRDERRPGAGNVEVLVDLTEIAAKGFGLATRASVTTLAIDGLPTVPGARHTALGDIYEQPKRFLKLRDTSDSGFGLEGSAEDCRGIGIGSLLGVRTAPGQPIVICVVMRHLLDGATGCVTIGTRTLTAAPQVLEVDVEPARGQRSRREALLFIPGDDTSGARDGFVVPDSYLKERMRLSSTLEDNNYAFRFNRVRQKGRGWSLAGFEIVSMRAAA